MTLAAFLSRLRTLLLHVMYLKVVSRNWRRVIVVHASACERACVAMYMRVRVRVRVRVHVHVRVRVRVCVCV